MTEALAVVIWACAVVWRVAVRTYSDGGPKVEAARAGKKVGPRNRFFFSFIFRLRTKLDGVSTSNLAGPNPLCLNFSVLLFPGVAHLPDGTGTTPKCVGSARKKKKPLRSRLKGIALFFFFFFFFGNSV